MIDKNKISYLTKEFLVAIGEDPDREGLIDTPHRVAEMCGELFTSKETKYTSFESNNYNGLVLVNNISFSSFCEHHLLPFYGHITIGYVPNKSVIGLSKIARIVDKHSHKLQLQERLATDILDDLNFNINPQGAAVYIEASHSCMCIRGVKKAEAITKTLLFSGCLTQTDLKNSFLSLI